MGPYVDAREALSRQSNTVPVRQAGNRCHPAVENSCCMLNEGPVKIIPGIITFTAFVFLT